MCNPINNVLGPMMLGSGEKDAETKLGRLSATTIWNSIPYSVRSSESTFRKHLKTLHFQLAFSVPLATYYPAPQIQLLDFGAL